MDPEVFELYQYYIGWFILLLIGQYVFKKATEKIGKHGQHMKSPIVVTDDFKSFQKIFLMVYLIMMGADWMQGPYVYALYNHYGFSQAEIGRLFIAGFGTSLVFGTVIGSLADKYGRKTSCLTYGVLYGLSCLTKHSHDFNVLMVGRILGGLSTSILFSSFEAWMVHEHHDASYPEDWLSLTFSAATSGNGLVAIGAGVLASLVRDQWGPVAPFDVSFILLVLGTVLIATKWNENFGDSNASVLATVATGWERLWEDPKILLLGAIQSCFEGAMYIFVFMWTPALEHSSTQPVFHGWVFASFMICVLAGSQLFELLMRMGHRVERFSVYTFGVASMSLLVPALIHHHTIRLLSFFVFEITVGMFWPSLGVMRSRYVPEEVRATVMNFFRIPLNMIVVLVLANISRLDEIHIFAVCTTTLLPALICQVRLLNLTADDTRTYEKKLDVSEEEAIEILETGVQKETAQPTADKKEDTKATN